MTYIENGVRIGKILEDRIPLLRKDTAGKDFRPGGGAEGIVSGIMICHPLNEPFALHPEPSVDESGPIEFKVLFGGEKLWSDAVEVLETCGIEVETRLPGLEYLDIDGTVSAVKRVTWRISFTLPQDWEFPVCG